MGCCVSTKANCNIEDKNQKLESESESCNGKFKNENRAPPPSLLEEETVKEVLSETPKLPSLAFIEPDEKKNPQNTVLEKIQEAEHDLEMKTKKVAITTTPAVNVDVGTNTEDAESEVSEICSVSMSESVSVNESIRREDEEEVRQQNQVRLRSPGKLQKPSSASRNRVVGKSPTRRSDPSPARRNGTIGIGGVESVKIVQGRDASQGIRRSGSRPDPRKKDPGESSGRRSKSPAINRSEMGRSPSARRTNRSPGRVGSDSSERKNSKMESKLEITDTESLENPLVSLECFIFL
ncbi:uncharacterized protein LOC110817836 [Carica papaya]|uniref:uncharacterized protein LOC110817836 n=1 Tax=Carica papaya TaxID=3649 RepID=UPI000B8CDDBB|nr:uncharacterized protein LOC110817836 [Carica papaya]